MDDFYKKHFENSSEKARVVRVTLEDLRELKDGGISTEEFLDYMCAEKKKLLHGSIYEIPEAKLTAQNGKIFASNKSAIAIMRSLYSNLNVHLEYSYNINKQNPLVLRVRVPTGGDYIKKDRGFVYVLERDGFINNPTGSWQFIKETYANISAIVETEIHDFSYPVKIIRE